MKISEAFDMYKRDFIRVRNQSYRTEETHDYVRGQLINYFGNIDVSEMDMTDVGKWVADMAKAPNPRSANTIRLYVIRLRRVLAYCRKREIPALNPDIIPVPKRSDPIPRFLFEDEVALMIDRASSIRNKFIISLLYSSGIRLSELISLDRGQIAERKFTLRGKGGRVRLCFIDERTEKLMEDYLVTRTDHNNALVVSAQNKSRMTKTNIELLVRNSAARAGISKKVTPHVLRHSYATNFLRNNGNMGYLSKMMGHKSMDTTMIYAHVVDNDLEDQYRRYHSV